MRCNFAATDEHDKNGRRVWRCGNDGCGIRCVGERPANCNQCRCVWPWYWPDYESQTKVKRLYLPSPGCTPCAKRAREAAKA